MGRGAPEKPSTPGWYPDPWSADGVGERYWDGKRWRGSDRADHPTVVRPEKIRRGRAGVAPSAAAPAPGRDRRRTVLGVAVLIAITVAVVWFQRRDDAGRSADSTVSASASSRTAIDAPPPGVGSADTPLGRPEPVPAGLGGYEFFSTQPGDPDTPVAWDPCRPIRYVVNPAGAPADGDALVAEALGVLSRATGLRFEPAGRTDERPDRARDPFQPRRYGDRRWAPVLIAWSNEAEYPELGGDIAGVAGPQRVQIGDSPMVYVTGQVVLDGQQLSTAALPDRADARAVILHELGHLAGLAHTSDARQLLYSEATRDVRDYQVGDLLGLAALGTQQCVPGV